MNYNQNFVVERFFKTIEHVKFNVLSVDAINKALAALKKEMITQKQLLLSLQNSTTLQQYLAQYAAELGLNQFLRCDVDAWAFDKDTPGLEEHVVRAISKKYSEILVDIAEAKYALQQQESIRRMREAQEEAERFRRLELDLVEKFAERQHERNRTVNIDADARTKSAQEHVNVLTTTVKDLAGVVVEHTKTVAEGYRTMLQPQVGATAQVANQATREQLPSEREQRELRQKQQVVSRRVGCVVAAFIGVSGLGILVLFLIYLAMHTLIAR